jgi:circadian clock protein KaiC
VLKMRDSENDPFLREFHITSRGLEVLEPFSSMEGMLTGLPRQKRATAPATDATAPKPKRRAPARKPKPSRTARSGARSPRRKGPRS